MLSFMRKKRCSYDLTLDQEQEQDPKCTEKQRAKRSSFKYFGLNEPENEVGSDEANALEKQSSSQENSPASNRTNQFAAKLSGVNEQDIEAVKEKISQEIEDTEEQQTSNQDQNGEIIEEKNTVFKKCDSFRRKESDKTEIESDLVMERKKEDKAKKTQSRPSLLDEVLAETSRLSVASEPTDEDQVFLDT